MVALPVDRQSFAQFQADKQVQMLDLYFAFRSSLQWVTNAEIGGKAGSNHFSML